MISVPHPFNELRIGPRLPTLVAGAGLSWGLVPGPMQLLKQKRADAERLLALNTTDIDESASDALYVWADIVLSKLSERSEPLPRLKLAEALGLLTDANWTADVGLPLRGTTPRHRVIARLARERRWSSMWSLNWDAHLENALEQVGFDRDVQGPKQPWITTYRAIVTREEFQYLGNNDLFCILKPHGCVRALLAAKVAFEKGDMPLASELADRLLITKSELTTRRDSPTDKIFFTQLTAYLTKSPLFVLGWSISEPYLISVINDSISDQLTVNKLEELTIVDPKFNDEGHTKACGYYKLTKEQVFVGLDIAGGFATDELFLWLQARYALDQLATHAPIGLKPAMLERIAHMTIPNKTSFLLSWADDFLPAWVRTCWRANMVPCAGYQPHELRLEIPDLHIPWDIVALPRPDLAAAAILLSQLPADGSTWDFSMFPGALWKKDTGQLVLPLPSWKQPSELSALLSLMGENAERLGFVSALDILPLDCEPNIPSLSADRIADLKQLVAHVMRTPKFADANEIGHMVRLI